MKRLLSLFLPAIALFACANAAQALTPKPNVGPAVTVFIGDYHQYRGAVRVIDLNSFFTDPDASAAVQVTTSLGVMNFTLDGGQAPLTVANFLNYIDSGRYFTPDPVSMQPASLFFHRSAFLSGGLPFVIQTGGYIGTQNPNGSGSILATPVVTFPPVVNEPFISNLRGTISMAKTSLPNSATSQWFINMSNNSSLDDPNVPSNTGGFTVFGRVAGTGMTVADSISALPRPFLTTNTTFNELPLRNYTPGPGSVVRVEHLVSIPSFARISPLTFSATSNDTAIATVTASGTDLIVNALSIGATIVTVTATDLDGVTASQQFIVNVIPAPARLRNISTRANFAGVNDVLIPGFIIRGGSSKMLAVRAIGPSLANFGIPNPIGNPTVELHGSGGVITSNDNWMAGPKKQLLTDLGLAPTSDNEAALVATVPSAAGNTSYTAVMRNADQLAGVGTVEVYDLDGSPGSTILNLSSRGTVGTGNEVMIGGFILGGDGTRRLVVRGIGPSLTQFGVPNALPDPMLELRNDQGTVVTSNDNWQTNPAAAEIQMQGLQPTVAQESAVIATLPAGAYTAILSGVGSQPTGAASIEIYQVD